MTRIVRWDEIKSKYQQGLLLGNGASIAIHHNFDYRNLVNKARTYGFITDRAKLIFEHFRTSDFEFVLNMVWHAHHVNRALEVGEKKTSRAYNMIRNAFIKTVINIHPKYSEVSTKLLEFGKFMSNFQTIASLNYDLLVYWARMLANDQNPAIQFKDCFINSVFDKNWRRLREPILPARKAPLVFYPHGNLAFTIDIQHNERKLVVGTASTLLDKIKHTWKIDELIPLFVSEGQSEQKLSTIIKSSYLRTVYQEVLTNIGTSLVIFGWSFSDSDDHILDALLRGNIKRIAISVHTRDPKWRDYCAGVRKKVRKHSVRGHIPKIIFFNSESVTFNSKSK